MIFVFGGAYQGKLDFAFEKFGVDKADVSVCSKDDATLCFDKKVIYRIEEFVFGCIERGESPVEYLKANLNRLEDKIIICTDVSQGIVPMDKTERAWREDNGRCMNMISAKADEVYRVFCGIGSKVR